MWQNVQDTYDTLGEHGNEGEVLTPASFGDLLADDDFVVMQFTGLLDKNGKEIYFGDILQTSNDGKDGCDVWGSEDNGYAVCYEDPDELGVRFKNWYPTTDEDSIFNMKYCEIIGNIYDHPNLLKANN